MEKLIDLAQSAPRILVPKSKDAIGSVAIFTQVTGIEVPETVWEAGRVLSAGREFRLAAGADMAAQIAGNWADLGIATSEIAVENSTSETRAIRISDERICSYSFMALTRFADEARDLVARSGRYPTKPKEIPATFPRYLNFLAAVQDLPLVASPVRVRSQGEYTMEASGIGMMAERVASGRMMRKTGAVEIKELAKIVTEIIVRNEV